MVSSTIGCSVVTSSTIGCSVVNSSTIGSAVTSSTIGCSVVNSSTIGSAVTSSTIGCSVVTSSTIGSTTGSEAVGIVAISAFIFHIVSLMPFTSLIKSYCLSTTLSTLSIKVSKSLSMRIGFLIEAECSLSISEYKSNE